MLQSCVFCNINVAKKFCKDFEKSIKCCNVNVARILENGENVAKTYCYNLTFTKNLNFIRKINVAKKSLGCGKIPSFATALY